MKEQRIQKLKRKLQESRFRIKTVHFFDASVLDEMNYIAVRDIEHISTDGKQICFHPDWLQKLSDAELDFILYHELMHILSGHIYRPQYYRGEKFHLACDIVANSRLLPCGWQYERLGHLGKIHYETFYPRLPGYSLTAMQAFKGIPFDPASLKAGERRKYVLDSDVLWGNKEDYRGRGVLVLSPADEDPPDLVAEDNSGGKYRFVPMEFGGTLSGDRIMDGEAKELDDDPSDSIYGQSVRGKILTLRQKQIEHQRSDIRNRYERREWEKDGEPELDWRRILNVFVQEDVYDYSFVPPDRRFGDTDFLMPDFSEKMDRPVNILFMADTSGSIEDGVLGTVFVELCGATEQFNQKLNGYIGFFDTKVYKPMPFASVKDIEAIQPHGGGGTDFGCIFDYVRTNMMADLPAKIIIFTDGNGSLPEEGVAMGIPVLWILNNKEAKAEWGTVARISKE